MQILVIGGSGHVGSLVTPVLVEKHTLRVFDRRPPRMESLEFFEGDVTNFHHLSEAMRDIEAVIYMAMGSLNWTEVEPRRGRSSHSYRWSKSEYRTGFQTGR